MKGAVLKAQNVLYFFSAVLAVGCAQAPIEATSALKKITQTYESTGDSSGIHPNIYAKRTIIQFDSPRPRNLMFFDEFDSNIDYRVEGEYIIFNSIEDIFTVQTGKRVVTFNTITPIEASPEEISLRLAAEKSTQETIEANKVALTKQAQQAIIYRPIFEKIRYQISQQRNLLNKAKTNSKAEKEEISNMKTKLKITESKLDTQEATIQLYSFGSKDDFVPNQEMANALLPAAKLAKKINLYGRSYSKGLANQKSAIARANAVKEYLINHGISADNIDILDFVSGDYLVPNNTNAGRNINRRVTMELVN